MEMSRRKFLKMTAAGILYAAMPEITDCTLMETDIIARTALKNDKLFCADLHIHPVEAFDYIPKETDIERYINSMKEKSLEAIAVASYEKKDIWSTFLKKAEEYDKKKKRIRSEVKETLIQFNDQENGDRYIIAHAQECRSQNLDIHIVGHKGFVEKGDFPDMIEQAHEKGGIVFGHTLYVDNNNELTGTISKDLEEQLKRYCKEEPEERRVDAFDFSAVFRPDIRFLAKNKLKGIIKLLGEGSGASDKVDVNEMARELAKKLGYSVIPYTDLHVRNNEHTKYLGTAFAVFSKESINFEDNYSIISSLRKNIKEDDFIGISRYVSLPCFWKTIVWPRLNNLVVEDKYRKEE